MNDTHPAYARRVQYLGEERTALGARRAALARAGVSPDTARRIENGSRFRGHLVTRVACAVPEDWGALVTLEVGETLSGRWRGDATDEEHDGRRVFRLWRLDGSLAWMRSYAALIREVDRAKPNIGDSVAIVRGEDYASKNGTGYSFGFAARPCSDSLPGSDDKNLPF